MLGYLCKYSLSQQTAPNGRNELLQLLEMAAPAAHHSKPISTLQEELLSLLTHTDSRILLFGFNSVIHEHCYFLF